MFIIGRQPHAGPEGDYDGEKWLKYYCSNHEILLVGDGDFSFSLSLARSFGSASHIVATSLDSYYDVVRKYKKARSNLRTLKDLGATVLHGVDVTKMKRHVDLHMRKFDRIIFNFPHAGFHGREDNVLMIQMHKRLVYEFFKNASQMLRADGEIHVNHKTKAPFCDWDIVQLALQNSLSLIGCANFNIQDYPGYKNKRGQGHRCDRPSYLGECCTFKFSINHRAKKAPRVVHMNAIEMQRNRPFQEMPISNHCHPHPYPNSFESSYSHFPTRSHPAPFEPDRSRVTNYPINAHSYQAPPPVYSLNQSSRTYHTNSLDTEQAYAFEEYLVNAIGALLSRSRTGMPERTSNGDVHRTSTLRSVISRSRSSNCGEERTDAHTAQGLFRHHW
ncbi:heavy metal-associated isoprenylated plant protein 41-like [Momordica charantia]|uniref:Heavy metal-associated isoprenylated plant protein 41-like n=1 Tax=Momordica charantia TaxID=3673 RepID=A0A6J1CD05_MOMCH|nr:heavy metal-associated isoprenylated plant protein 41-like [Momordica charantia]